MPLGKLIRPLVEDNLCLENGSRKLIKFRFSARLNYSSVFTFRLEVGTIKVNNCSIFQATQFIHAVEKISFISRDTTDRRAFGYIVEGEKNQFHFFGIKTGNAAEGLVLALRDLFQVVYDIKQKEKSDGNQTQAADSQMTNLQQVCVVQLNIKIPYNIAKSGFWTTLSLVPQNNISRAKK